MVYLSYSSVQQTIYKTSSYPTLPSITLCGPKAQFITDQYFEQKFGHPVNRPIPQEKCHQINEELNNKTISDQFKYLISENDLAQQIQLKFPLINGHSSSGSSEIVTKINANLFCMTLFQDHNISDHFDYNNLNNKYPDPLVSIKLKLKIPEILVAIRPSYETILDMEDRYQVISLEDRKTTNIYFEKTTISRLPAPYDTNCENRESNQRALKGKAFTISMNCMIHFNCYPDFYLADNETGGSYCSNTMDIKNLPEIVQDKNDLKADCYQEYYTLTQNKGHLVSKLNDSIELNFYPAKLNLAIYITPAMTMVDLIEKIGSVVGFWLGLIAVYVLIGIRIEKNLSKFD